MISRVFLPNKCNGIKTNRNTLIFNNGSYLLRRFFDTINSLSNRYLVLSKNSASKSL